MNAKKAILASICLLALVGGTHEGRRAFLRLSGGILTGEVTVDDLGFEFTAGDALTDCSTFATTNGGLFYDDSEGVFKKCQDNTLTDLDTAGAHTGTIIWGGTAILESGTAFQFGDGTDATVTHTYGNSGTDVVIAYSTSLMNITTGTLQTTAQDLSDGDLLNTGLIEADTLAPDGTALTIGDGGGAVTVNSTTGIPMTTTATECVMLNAGAINCDTTNGCATADTAGTNFDYTVAAFATAADDFGAFAFPTPTNISGTTFTAQIMWTSDNAACDNTDTSDDVCWTVAASGIANDAAWNGASLGTAQAIVDRCLANGDLMLSATTVTAVTHGWAADEMAIVEISRDVDAGHANCAADAYPNDALLLAVKICYEVDNVFSGE